VPDPAHISFRLSAQRALLGAVTPPLRAVSMAVDEAERRWAIRFVFDGQASESQLEAARVSVTEIVTDHLEWGFAEEYLFVAAPQRMQHLSFLVYLRCEDEWVRPDANNSPRSPLVAPGDAL
jgi:hypothetical protein